MPKIKYVDVNFRKSSLDLIDLINSIVSEYKHQGYDLTLRQVYYQLVARGYIPNSDKSYKSIGNILNDGRLAGLIDWDSIEDRTRYLRNNSHWSRPSSVLVSASRSFAYDKWKSQGCYVEVWVEKDALIGVIQQTCTSLDVPCFSCRGYVSQSEMWVASQRIVEKNYEGKDCHILHLGDHDPSGIDMTRDIKERLSLFGADVEVNRIALTMEQIETYSPPPNPAKLTDTRASSYIERYGDSSWELDALDPRVLDRLIKDNVGLFLDVREYQRVLERENRHKETLMNIAEKATYCGQFANDLTEGREEYVEPVRLLKDVYDDMYPPYENRSSEEFQ